MADDLQPNATSSDYDAMVPYWDMIDAILGGASAMREAGVKYLPRFQNEKPTVDANGAAFDPYESRRKQAPFTNIYEDISRNLSAKPFAKELKLKEGTPDNLVALAENIDGQGNNFHVFGQRAFRAGIDDAITWVLVDFVKMKPGATLADERSTGARPYWVHIPAKRMLAAYSEFLAGKEIIYHARISESAVVVENFKETTVERVRVFDRQRIVDTEGNTVGFAPARWELWESRQGVDKATVWAKIGEGPITIGEIPLVKFITGTRKGNGWQVTPPLQGIAYQQIQAYQQESNLQNLEIMTGFAMLVGEGVDLEKGTVVPVGPRGVLTTPPVMEGSPGTWRWIEPSHESMKVLAERLTKTQTDMRDLGLQPLTQANLTVITTGQVAVKANSAVQAWAILFKDAMEQAWAITAKWLTLSVEPEVDIHTDFGADLQGQAELDTLNKARDRKDISQKVYLGELVRKNVLGSNFDIDQNEADLAEEMQGLEGEQQIDPRTGRPIDPQQQAAA